MNARQGFGHFRNEIKAGKLSIQARAGFRHKLFVQTPQLGAELQSLSAIETLGSHVIAEHVLRVNAQRFAGRRRIGADP